MKNRIPEIGEKYGNTEHTFFQIIGINKHKKLMRLLFSCVLPTQESDLSIKNIKWSDTRKRWEPKYYRTKEEIRESDKKNGWEF